MGNGNYTAERLVDEVIHSTPLLFIKAFLRDRRKESRTIRIGVTRSEVRSNLLDAVLRGAIGLDEVVRWQASAAGWGRQHLYMHRVPVRSLTQPHLLNEPALQGFLQRRGYTGVSASNAEPDAHRIASVSVDDEVARVTWVAHAIDLERVPEFDVVEEREDAEYEFHAYRRRPVKSSCHTLVRKTDGLVLHLVDMQLGDEHETLLAKMSELSGRLVAPLQPKAIALAPIVGALDAGALTRHSPRAQRGLSLDVAPSKTRYRTDGASVEFRSTRQTLGYTDSDPVRHVRRALQVEAFESETGKFRLVFEGRDHADHDMVVSLNAIDNRLYLFSRMNITEVLALVDQLLAATP